MRARLLLVVLALAALAAGGVPGAAGAAVRSKRASCPKPTRVALTRAPGATRGKLTWRAPRGVRGLRGYAVYRDGRLLTRARRSGVAVAVSPGRSYRFEVRAIARNSRPVRCAAALRQAIPFARPGRPAGVSADAVTQTGAQLSWRAGPPGDGRLAGYRVLRDGALVGQTASTTMHLALAPGRSYTVTVVAVDSRGNRSEPSEPVAVTTTRTVPGPPRAPHGLAVDGVTDTGARLTWLPPDGDTRPVGYRVLRDGALVGQTPGTSMRLTLASARSYALSVVAVDARGNQSEPSAPLRVTTTHGTPSAPSGLTASNATETSIDLTWAPSQPTSGTITGYRVFRNGALLGQVAGPAMRVANLAGATSYSFTVVALDSFGFASPVSAPVTASTSAPAPTQGRMHAFLLASTDQSFADLREHYRQVGVVYPTYYDCNSAGQIVGSDNAQITGWARARRIQVLPRINCQEPNRLHRILTDATVRAATLDRLAGLVHDFGYDGVNIDFEAGLDTDRAALTAFVSDLAARLHGVGAKVSIAVSPKSTETTTGRSGFYDYPALGRVVDWVFVMNWGIHYTTSAPGALEELQWATRNADYVATMENRAKWVLGTPLYGLDWPTAGTNRKATALEWGDIQALQSAYGVAPQLDPVTDEWHFTYTTSAGVPHEVWYVDETTTAKRIQLAKDRGLGIGVWHLGREDGRLWDHPLLAPGSTWP